MFELLLLAHKLPLLTSIHLFHRNIIHTVLTTYFTFGSGLLFSHSLSFLGTSILDGRPVLSIPCTLCTLTRGYFTSALRTRLCTVWFKLTLLSCSPLISTVYPRPLSRPCKKTSAVNLNLPPFLAPPTCL
ncbi:mCG147255 [Mus musculus]|nr:mCG147255 [Mus musculus]